MEKFIPYEKLSKKEKRKLDAAKRGTWGEINPVTRKPQNSKAYNRKKAQNWKKGLPDSVLFYFIVCSQAYSMANSLRKPIASLSCFLLKPCAPF